MFLKLPVSLLTFVHFSCALRLSFEARRVPPARRGLHRRGSLSGSSPLDNSADLEYTTNITVGGVPFEVLIDTGSADLWVAGEVPSSTSTGKAATIAYASGGASGPVQLAPVVFNGFTVPNQAFVLVPPDSAHPVGQGLIGLGPSDGSVIFEAFAAADEGNTVLDNIFTQDTSTPNFISFLLGRLNDPSETFPGDLTVGEVMSNYTNITSQPKLAVTEVSASNSANQHFQLLLDANGFIGPDGSSIPITSVVGATSNKKQATVVIDTGFSLPQVPTSVAKAIYGQFSGAQLVSDPDIGSIWYVPCTQEVNVTLKFGGNAYPVHPLDTTIDPVIFGLKARQTATGENACLGLFQPTSFDTGSSPTYDIIFGMAFLRNVYTLINFGDFVADGTSKADPYIQFLSTTDPADAHSDFVKQRLNGVDTTTVLTHSPSTDNDDHSGGLSRTTYYIIAGCVAGALLLLVLAAFIFKRSRSRARGVYRPLTLPGGPPPMYQQNANAGGPVYAPQQPYGAGGPGYNPDRPYDPPQERVPYHNPWEGRRQ
ncbi:aspartic peptidase domain-containing protein [Mycena filopes]|nr:aspartic peptidase domain-containing protein [Mycena filopes]